VREGKTPEEGELCHAKGNARLVVARGMLEHMDGTGKEKKKTRNRKTGHGIRPFRAEKGERERESEESEASFLSRPFAVSFLLFLWPSPLRCLLNEAYMCLP
jgi:hypothetical protein